MVSAHSITSITYFILIIHHQELYHYLLYIAEIFIKGRGAAVFLKRSARPPFCESTLKVLSSEMDKAESRLIRWAFLKGNVPAGF